MNAIFWNLLLIPFGLGLLLALGLADEEWSGPRDIFPAALRGWNHIAKRVWKCFRLSAKTAFWLAILVSAIVGAAVFFAILPHSLLVGIEFAAAYLFIMIVVVPAFARALDSAVSH